MVKAAEASTSLRDEKMWCGYALDKVRVTWVLLAHYLLPSVMLHQSLKIVFKKKEVVSVCTNI